MPKKKMCPVCKKKIEIFVNFLTHTPVFIKHNCPMSLKDCRDEKKAHLTKRAPDALRVYDMGEVAGVKLTYVNGNVFATPAKRG